MTDRAVTIHRCRVLIAQSQAFWRRTNGTRYFAFTMLEWAGNARRRLNEPKQVQHVLPIQGELFQ